MTVKALKKNNMNRRRKGPMFKMKSGNKTTFKMMGSTSPMRNDPPVAETEELVTQDSRIGTHIGDLGKNFKTGSQGLTSTAKNRQEEQEIFDNIMNQEDGKIVPGKSFSKLFGGKWTKGWTDPKTKVFHENTWSNEDGKNVQQMRTGFNANMAGTVSSGDGNIIGTTEVDRYGKVIDPSKVEKITSEFGRRQRLIAKGIDPDYKSNE